MPRRFRYEPALDGIRAMAIMLVLAAHSLPHAAGGGYGVNIFFTLSGFLITALLLVEYRATESIWMGGFYLRRALRLLPPLVLMLALVAAIPNVYLQPSDGHSISRLISIPAALFYVANIVAAFGHPLGFVAHTWSLAIEEQFYFIWPLAFLWLVSTKRLKLLPALIVAAVVARLLLVVTHVPGISDWLPAQADQLLIGALLAVVFLDGRAAWLKRRAVGWIGLVTLAVLALIGTADHQGSEGSLALYGGLTVCGLASAALIGHLITADTGWLHRIFAFRPFVWLGRVSYGVYLFHFPIFQWVQHERWPSLAKTMAVEYALTAVAVLLSWFFVERQALRLKDRRARPRQVPSHEPAVQT